MRFAAIDLGTNSVRFLAAEVSENSIKPIKKMLKTTRLGAGLVERGVLSQAGKEATAAAVMEFIALAHSLGVGKLKIAGTSAMREALDGQEFARSLSKQTGKDVEIISPDEEARLSYEGAAKSLRLPHQALVFDLGGGSCEFIWPESGNLRFASLKLGAVYLTEMFVRSDPPSTQEFKCIGHHVSKLLSCLTPAGMPIVGIGGTVTSLAAMEMQMTEYDEDQVHGYTLTAEMISSQLKRLLAVPLIERGAIPGVQPDRADILPAGALVVGEILTYFNATSLIVSEGDILMGMLYSLF